MAFSGFPRDGVRFFRELAVRQDRDWFKAHKDDYVRLWEAPMRALMDELVPQVERHYPKVKLEPVKHFRIYRDVRFSRDKSPFKTRIASMVGFKGEDMAAALYLSFGLEEEAAAGHWMLSPERLKRLRQLIAADETGRELMRRVEALESRGFTIESMEQLKRVPPPYPADHPRARLLKHKGLGIAFPKIPAAVRSGPKLKKWIIDQSAQAAPLVRWLEERL
jgi:uncharacterized protein (TIGR02453 family)